MSGLYLHTESLHLLYFLQWNNVFLSVSKSHEAEQTPFGFMQLIFDPVVWIRLNFLIKHPLFVPLLYLRPRSITAVYGVRKYICVQSCDFN